jgi:CarD family transcriptional regulator
MAAQPAAAPVAVKHAPEVKPAALKQAPETKPVTPPAAPKPAMAKPPSPPVVEPAAPADAASADAASADAASADAEADEAPETATPVAPAPVEAAASPAQAATRTPGDQARRPGAPGMHTGPITAPRIPAKAEVFHEGDHVVYPTHGVGKVERIATEEIAGHKLELIHITFEENRMTLRVPVAKARTAGLRKLATRKLFDEALNVLKGRARIKRTMWSRRAQEYEAKINSGDPLAIAEVVRDLHRNAGQPDQSFSERQIYEAAMERLAAELAALDKTDKATAATKLTDFLKTV